MNNQDFMLDTESGSIPESKKQSTFIKVLCILTFVGSGFWITESILGIKAASALKYEFNPFDDTLSPFEDSGIQYRQMIRYYNWAMYSYITVIIGSIITTVASMLMLSGKKSGFYIYLLGEASPVIISVFVIIAARGFRYISFVATFTSSLLVLTSLIFIVLYSINYKKLR